MNYAAIWFVDIIWILGYMFIEHRRLMCIRLSCITRVIGLVYECYYMIDYAFVCWYLCYSTFNAHNNPSYYDECSYDENYVLYVNIAQGLQCTHHFRVPDHSNSDLPSPVRLFSASSTSSRAIPAHFPSSKVLFRRSSLQNGVPQGGLSGPLLAVFAHSARNSGVFLRLVRFISWSFRFPPGIPPARPENFR